METYIIYHQVKPGIDCPDGIAAAWVASKVYPNAQILGWVYQSLYLPKVESGDTLIIVDFSFPSQAIAQWINEGVSVEIFDHHKTAEKALMQFNVKCFQESLAHDDWKIVFNMDECGATLVWRYFFPNKRMPVFLEYIRDRDLWQFELEGSHEVHEAMSKIGRTFDLFDRLAQMSRKELLACLKPIGEVLLKPKRAAVEVAVNRAQKGEVAGHQIVYVVLNLDV